MRGVKSREQMLSQRAPILLSCALLARAADEGTALDRELYDVCRQKTPLVPLADVEALLEKGANASFIGEYDYTPLMWACVRHRPDLSATPDEDAAEDAVGKTPLEVAKTEAVRELLREAEAAAEDAVLRLSLIHI